MGGVRAEKKRFFKENVKESEKKNQDGRNSNLVIFFEIKVKGEQEKGEKRAEDIKERNESKSEEGGVDGKLFFFQPKIKAKQEQENNKGIVG